MNTIPVICYGVAAIVIKDDRILLLRRTGPLKGTWCYVVGKIEASEKAWQGALREIKEETGLIPSEFYSADIQEQFYEIGKDSIRIAPVFVGYILDKQEVKINEEHDDFKWVTIEEALQMLSFPGQRKIIEHIEEEFIKKKPSEWLMNFGYQLKKV